MASRGIYFMARSHLVKIAYDRFQVNVYRTIGPLVENAN